MTSSRRLLPLLVGLCALCSLVAAPSALAASPWWSLSSGYRPFAAAAETKGQVVVSVANLGDAVANGELSPVTIVDKLPAGLKASSIKGFAGERAGNGNRGTVTCALESLTCTFTGTLPSYRAIEVVIDVTVLEPGVPLSEANEAIVTGGGAGRVAGERPISLESPQFGVEDYELRPEEEGGEASTQAGSHPFQLTTSLAFNQTLEAKELPRPVALTKDIDFKWPPGLIGNPTAVPSCPLGQFLANAEEETEKVSACPSQTAVGVARVVLNGYGNLGLIDPVVPVFNLEPAVGEPARFGFRVLATPVLIDTSIRTGGDYGVTVSVENVAQTVGFVSSQVTVWGVPGDPRHDSARGYGCLAESLGLPHKIPCSASNVTHPLPFIALPTSCTGPLTTSVESDSWAHPEALQTFPSREPMTAMDGCNQLPFSPTIQVTPDGTAGSTPTGLTVDVHVPQALVLNPAGVAESDVRDTTVALPAGMALSPSAGDGLQACSPQEIALQSPEAPTCPEASKVGTLEIKTPLLPNPLFGAAYVAEQNANPFGSLFALYLVAEDPVSGVRVKLAGEIAPDPVSGQLVSSFKDTPQLPFEDLKLHFFGGERAPLSTPSRCGTYETAAIFSPWSGNEAVNAGSAFDIESGPNHSPCQSPLPFAPLLAAGSTNIQAGGFTPFTTTISREDGQQSIKAITLRMPPGLSGILAGVKLCPDAQANAGTCGPESLIGETTVSVGLGGDPFSVKGGRVYITEGYGGAPFGLSVVNPAKAGPYDLGQGACDCIVVRARIEVDPRTAALTVATDSEGPYRIPTILDGVPLQIKHVNVTITRPGFTFNPTNCHRFAIEAGVTAEEAASTLSVPFQVTNCASLGFTPSFSVSTSGKTSKLLGASLSVKLSYPKGALGVQANIASVKVELPRQLPSRLDTLQEACLAATFDVDPAKCPARSVVGHAKVITPILPVPLEGPAYFVSHGGEAFPSLTMVLKGYGVTVELVGDTFISKRGITSSTFKTTPDVPFNSFELVLPEGRFSALGAIANLCKSRLNMPTVFKAQNGAELKQTTRLHVTGCPKRRRQGHGRRKRHG